jgi:D-arabinose 1-dehydrogenase-like Zn-dependent alcohol dehydrogenase
VGWHGGHCGHCESCRRGDSLACSYAQVSGISYDGGYADYMVAPIEAIVSIPDELSFTEAAPLMCAGITTYNALRNSGARPGDVVAILGTSGLGHLGIQFASKMGFKTIAISRGKDKEDLVKKLGAIQYIDSKSQNPVEELVKLGGAKIILGTASSGKAMTAVLGGLSINGKLIMIGASDESVEISSSLFVSGRRSVIGWNGGTSIDSQDTLSFSVLSGVRSINQIFPLDLMMNGKARFRAVLTTEQ